jgi:microsomal dipeptidase-like Zn-dependent dipeptidase
MPRLSPAPLALLCLASCNDARPLPPAGRSPAADAGPADAPTPGTPPTDAFPTGAGPRPELPPWRWGPIRRDDCTPAGLRRISAPLRNLPAGVTAETACANAPRNVLGIPFSRPDGCARDGDDVRGRWDVPDTSCAATPPPAPTRGGEGKLASAQPLEGWADLHLHQMANLGFGGSVVWGAAFGPPAEALSPIPAALKAGHDRCEAFFDGDIAGGLAGLATHDETGYPSFSAWPSREIATHQQAYEDWLFRAYQGGLRLTVMLAVNSEDMFGRGENDLGLLNAVTVQGALAPGRTANDMEALEWQVREAYRMQEHIDGKHGGPGRGWYRIVRDPAEAGAAIAAGQMAVILGTELQHLFNCDADRPACTQQTITEGLDRLEAMGVNYVFPVHHKLNQFGGAAQFNVLTSGPTADCWETQEACAADGLSPLGRFLVEELTARGMLIDTEHLSWKAFDDTLSIAETRRYPVLAGHIGPFDLKTEASQTEQLRRTDQIQRILGVGGMLGLILGVGADEYARSLTAPPPVPISCGGADRWANAYLYLRDLAGGGQSPAGGGRLTFGSDWNGFAGWPAPRYAATACQPRTARDGKPIAKPAPISYPLALPAGLVPAAVGATDRLPMFDQFRPWDYNALGLMHAGLLPDFMEDLRNLGLTLADLEPIYRSARGVVELWQTARDRQVPGDRHHLRWVPHRVFDLLDFQPPADPGRAVEAAPGFPLCRLRRGPLLGFERDGACQLVEPADPPPLTGTLPAVAISGYHAGRCLDVEGESDRDGARVQSFRCNGGDHQRWSLRGPGGGAPWELVNVRSGLCLDSEAAGRAGSLAQRPCTSAPAQAWQAVRTGNTFSLRTAAGLCLQVAGQSRADGAAVELAACTGAAHQQWQIDSLRAADHDRLYQADKNQIAWLPAADATHPHAVTLDGSRELCRSLDPTPWPGVVSGAACTGRTYDGAPATTPRFERLFQTP